MSESSFNSLQTYLECCDGTYTKGAYSCAATVRTTLHLILVRFCALHVIASRERRPLFFLSRRRFMCIHASRLTVTLRCHATRFNRYLFAQNRSSRSGQALIPETPSSDVANVRLPAYRTDELEHNAEARMYLVQETSTIQELSASRLTGIREAPRAM